MVRSLVGPLFAVLLVGAVATGCDKADTGDKGYIDGTGLITRLAVDKRKKPGEVSGETLSGKKLDLSSYAGKVVVLNVWGSWCPPCRKEAPTLVAASKELAKDDVVFVGVNSKDSSPDTGRAYERRFEVPYDSLFDPSGRTLLAFHGTLTIRVDGDIMARTLKAFGRKLLVDALDLLQAGHIGLCRLEPLQHRLQARIDRVHVPGGDAHRGLRRQKRRTLALRRVGLNGREPPQPCGSGPGAGSRPDSRFRPASCRPPRAWP